MTRKPVSTTHARIYAAIRRIPRGRVATYGQIAQLAGMPGQARLVGYALFASTAGGALPWHRVLGAGGRLTIAGLDPDAALTQRLRLEREGVRFTPHGRVDMAKSQWKRGLPGHAAGRRPPRNRAPN